MEGEIFTERTYLKLKFKNAKNVEINYDRTMIKQKKNIKI